MPALPNIRFFIQRYKNNELAREIFFFCVVGGIGFVVDFLSFVTAQNYLNDVNARCLALAIATFVTWQLNRHLTFRSSDPRWLRELGRFTLTRVVGAAINAGVSLGILWEFPQAGRLLALASGTGVALLINYFSAKMWAYQKPVI